MTRFEERRRRARSRVGGWRTIAATAILAAALGARPARGDGGAVRFSGAVGPYHATLFTDPTPLRVGVADVSVLVVDPKANGSPDVEVRFRVANALDPSVADERLAGVNPTGNRMLRSALVEFDQAGAWEIELEIRGPAGSGRATIAVEVAAPAPKARDITLWIAAPAAPILLFLVVKALSGPPSRRSGDGS